MASDHLGNEDEHGEIMEGTTVNQIRRLWQIEESLWTFSMSGSGLYWIYQLVAAFTEVGLESAKRLKLDPEEGVNPSSLSNTSLNNVLQSVHLLPSLINQILFSFQVMTVWMVNLVTRSFPVGL